MTKQSHSVPITIERSTQTATSAAGGHSTGSTPSNGLIAPRIERDIPLPRWRSTWTKQLHDTMLNCNVGDSFFVEGLHRRKALAVFVSRVSRKMGRRFSVWKEGEVGARVWRIE